MTTESFNVNLGNVVENEGVGRERIDNPPKEDLSNGYVAGDNINIDIFKPFDGMYEWLKQPEYNLILLYPWQKKPAESEWEKTKVEDLKAYGAYLEYAEAYDIPPRLHNYRYDDPYLLEKLACGYNLGLICNINGPKVFDADELERLEELGIMQKFPKTRTHKTPSGGVHKFLNVTGDSHKVVLYDPEKKEKIIDEEGKIHSVYRHLGEFQSGNAYIVCPGSTYRKLKDNLSERQEKYVLKHPEWDEYPDCFEGPELGYEVIDDSPIATITFEELLEIFKGLKFSKRATKAGTYKYDPDSKKLADQIGLKVEDLVDTSGFYYTGDELQGAHPVHGSKNGRNFAINSAKNMWYCYRCNSGGDAISLVAVLDGIIDCSECIKGFWSTPEGKEKYPQVLDAIRKRGYKVPGYSENEVPEEIKIKAKEVLEKGDPIQYIIDSCERMVLGATKAFRKLICCVAVQGVKQSAGLHPKLNGESGSGKTYAVLMFALHLPPEAVVTGSTSDLAVFYHESGNQVFRILDDYQAGNETLDTIIKQTSSVFHQKYPHKTTIRQKPKTLFIGSEQTWAITSVDSSQDIQVLNRQLPINVDDSEELTKAINARTVERYGKGEEQYSEDETVLVCREIWRILRSEGLINVKIPYFGQIDWLDNSNRRNPSIFLDLLVAHTAMYRYQREKDAEGFYLATRADFEAAKALFNDKDAEELVKRLTRKEREFANLLCKNPNGLARKEVAEALDISESRVSQLANGEKGKGGLTQKLSGFHVEEVSDTETLGNGGKRTTRKTLYKLTHYDPLGGFDAVVILRENNNTSQP